MALALALALSLPTAPPPNPPPKPPTPPRVLLPGVLALALALVWTGLSIGSRASGDRATARARGLAKACLSPGDMIILRIPYGLGLGLGPGLKLGLGPGLNKLELGLGPALTLLFGLILAWLG